MPSRCFKYGTDKRWRLWIIFLLTVSFPAWAQTQPGNHLVGMNVGELVFSFRDRRGSSIGLNPAYGQFLRPNLALGLEIPFYYSHSDYRQAPRQATHLALTPFVRYYIGQGWVKPFVSLLAGPRYINTREFLPTTSTTRVESDIDLLYGLRTGLAFFVNQWVSLDIALSYVVTSHKVADLYGGTNALGYDESNGLALNVGFQVYLGNPRRYSRW